MDNGLESMVMTQPVIVGNILYIGSGNDFVNFTMPQNNVLAINMLTGAVIWNISTVQENMPTFAYFNGSVIVLPGLGGNGYLHAYNLSTGMPIWNLSLGGYSAMSSITLVDNIAYIGLRNIMEPSTRGANTSNLFTPIHNSTFYAVDLRTHKIIWSRVFNVSLGVQDTSPSVWGNIIVTGYAIPITPVQKASSTYASPKYKIKAYLAGLNASNGKLLWTFYMGSGYVGPRIEINPTSAYNNLVYSDTFSTGVLYAINMTTGTKVWAINTGPTTSDVNMVGGYAILANSINGTVFVIDSKGNVKSIIDMNMHTGPVDEAVVGDHLLLSSVNRENMTGEVESVPISQIINNTYVPIPPTLSLPKTINGNSQIQTNNNQTSTISSSNQSVYCASCYN